MSIGQVQGRRWTPMKVFVAIAVAAGLAAGCGDASDLPHHLMPVKVTVGPHLPDTLDLGVHLKIESLADEILTLTIQIDSERLRNSPGRDDLSLHPIYRGDGPVQITLQPRANLDFWFTQDQLAPDDSIVVTARNCAPRLVRVPTDAKRGPVEAIAIGPVE